MMPIYEDVWKKIKAFSQLYQGKPIPILNPSIQSTFMITEVSDDYIKIDKIQIKMTKNMFLSIYDYLKCRGCWVEIGARRVGARPNTLEGFIKNDLLKVGPDGLSTATWFAAIMIHADIGIDFNNVAKGQKLRWKLDP